MGVDRNTGKLQARDWEEPPPRKANEELLDHQRKRKVCLFCQILPVDGCVLFCVGATDVVGILCLWWWWGMCVIILVLVLLVLVALVLVLVVVVNLCFS